jgi:hypothetical protein
MLYKNRAGIVHRLDPLNERTIKWVGEKSMIPLTEEETKIYCRDNKIGDFENLKHEVTKKDLHDNPTLVAEGVKEGDPVELEVKLTADELRTEFFDAYTTIEPIEKEEVDKIKEWLASMEEEEFKDVDMEKFTFGMKYRYKKGRKPHHTWDLKKIKQELI